MDRTTVVVHPNPLVAEHRRVSVAAFLPGETLGRYCERVGMRVPTEAAVFHNGYHVPDALWTRLIPRTGDHVIIRARAEGPGGGGDSNKVLRTVATLAVVALAVSAPYLAPAAWGVGAGTTGGALLTAGVMFGGGLMVNALLPPPRPSFDLASAGKYDASPTYSITGGRNRARLLEVMPLVMGRHKIVPDYGAQFYTEYVGNDQYLNQIFHFGLQPSTEMTLTDLKLGETPLSSFQDVQTQVSGADGVLTMFPGNVDTISGFTLPYNAIQERTTAASVTHIKVEFAAILFEVDTGTGNLLSKTVDLRIQWRALGASTWNEIGARSDATYATHYWAFMVSETVIIFSGQEGGVDQEVTFTRQVAFDSTNFADHTDFEEDTFQGFEGFWQWTPHPYALGEPWYGIAPDPLLSTSTIPGVQITGASQQPTRRTIAWDVPEGQYELRIWKETPDVSSSTESNETAVNQILCFQTDNADYTGQYRMAVRIKATGQISGTVDDLSAVAIPRIPVWTGTAWATRNTSNPAWWFLWFARGKYIAGKRIYGEGRTDDEIDIEEIKAWAQLGDVKNLRFNWVLDRSMSCDETLQTIARAGRGSPSRATGKLSVIWDEADKPVMAIFGPPNIVAGTFSVNYINEGTADEIVLNFINELRGWGVDEVRVLVPGETTTSNPLQLDLEGCTNADQAGREANLIAASQVWHRRRISWESDFEGWVAGRGDVVQLSHDLTSWSYSGRLVSADGLEITLDRPVPTGSNNFVMLRAVTGEVAFFEVSGGPGDVDTLTITSDLDDFPLPGPEDDPIDWVWFFDPATTPGKRVKIVSVEPAGDNVKFEAIDDAPEYYASEDDPFEYQPPRGAGILGSPDVLAIPDVIAI